MSLKLIFSFIIFVALTVYFTLLNPSDIVVHLTQNLSIKVPFVAFTLVWILLGGLVTFLLTGFKQFKNSFKTFKVARVIKAQEKNTRKSEQLYLQAKNAVASGQDKKGLALFEKILGRQPGHVDAMNQLGNLYRASGQHGKAIDLHKKALCLNPENIPVSFSLAQDHAAAGEHEREVKILNGILSRQPNSVLTLRKLRRAYQQANLTEKAYLAQKSILPLIHEPAELKIEQALFSEIIYQKGSQLVQSKKFEQAIAEFKRSIRENSQSLPAYITLGDIHLECDDFKAALKVWKAGFRNTGSPICLIRMHRAYEKLGKPGEALKLFKEAIRQSENHAKETLGMIWADLQLKQGETGEALDTLKNISDPALPVRLFSLKIAKEKNDTARADEITQSVYDKIADTAIRFQCSQCESAFDRWSGVCPSCSAWSTLTAAVIPSFGRS